MDRTLPVSALQSRPALAGSGLLFRLIRRKFRGKVMSVSTEFTLLVLCPLNTIADVAVNGQGKAPLLLVKTSSKHQ